MFFRLLMLFFLAPSVLFARELCSDNINFSNGNTTKNYSGKVICTDSHSGLPTRRLVLKSGKKHGLETRYNHKGTPLSEIYYVDGEKHGTEKRYHHVDGYIETTTEYENDVEKGVSRRFYPSGQLQKEKVVGNNMRSFVKYAPDGSLSNIACGEIFASKDHAALCNKKTIVLYSNKDTIERTITRSDVVLVAANGAAQKDGLHTEYHKNGNVHLTYTVQNGALEGEQNRYREDGTLEASEFFTRGMKDKTQRTYFTDGKRLKQTTVFKAESHRIIRDEHYYENGAPKSIAIRNPQNIWEVTRYSPLYPKHPTIASEEYYFPEDGCGDTLCFGNPVGEHMHYEQPANSVYNVRKNIYHPSNGQLMRYVLTTKILGSEEIISEQAYYPDGSEIP